MRALSQEVAVAGYGTVEGVVDCEEIARLIGAIGAVLSGRAKSPGHRDGYAVRHLLRDCPEVHQLAVGLAGRSPLCELLPPEARPVRGIYFDKTAESNWAVGWHQDVTIAVEERVETAGYGPWSMRDGVPHVQPPVEVLEGLMIVRIHLDDCGEANGPLRVIPGTHRLGKLAGEEVKRWMNSGPIETVTVGSGGAVVMRPLLLHASSQALSAGHRRTIHLVYRERPLPEPLRFAAA